MRAELAHTSNAPPGPARRGCVSGSVAAATAVRAGPDQAVAFAVLVVEEVGEDRGGEARIVELEAQIVAALVGALRPGCTDLDLMRCTALSGLCGVRNYAER